VHESVEVKQYLVKAKAEPTWSARSFGLRSAWKLLGSTRKYIEAELLGNISKGLGELLGTTRKYIEAELT